MKAADGWLLVTVQEQHPEDHRFRLTAMAGLRSFIDGLQSTSNGLQPKSNGLQPMGLAVGEKFQSQKGHSVTLLCWSNLKAKRLDTLAFGTSQSYGCLECPLGGQSLQDAASTFA